MSNRKKIQELEAQLEAELAPITKKYQEQINALYYQFTIEELLKAGWVKDDFYPAMSSGSDYVYYYVKNGHRIIVHTNPVTVRSVTTMQPTICDWEELNEISG